MSKITQVDHLKAALRKAKTDGEIIKAIIIAEALKDLGVIK
jgi:hypothetical protein